MSYVVGDGWLVVHFIAAILLAVSCSELCFARCCAQRRTGIFASERLFVNFTWF